MPSPTVYKAVVWQNGVAALLARVENINGTGIQQSNLTSIILTSRDKADGMTLIYTVTLTISAVIFNTLQTTDPRWDVDEIGYNFLYVVSGAAFPNPRVYHLNIQGVFSDGSTYPLVQYDDTAAPVP